MDDNWEELRSTRIAEVVGVVDAATAVMVGIHEDDDMLVGCTCQHVMEPFQVEGSEVAVAIKSVEMGTESGISPNSFRRFAGA